MFLLTFSSVIADGNMFARPILGAYKTTPPRKKITSNPYPHSQKNGNGVEKWWVRYDQVACHFSMKHKCDDNQFSKNDSVYPWEFGRLFGILGIKIRFISWRTWNFSIFNVILQVF